MAKLLPFRSPERATRERAPQLVNLDDEDAEAVFAALSSDTARAILNRLYEEPATASDVADAADTSLQNARYHLEKLGDAGLIEEVDTWYSSRGTEMTVYAPTSEPLVVAAGREESTSVLRDALTRVLGAVALLAVASVVVDRVIRRLPGPGAYNAAEGGGDGGAQAGAAGFERTETRTEAAVETGTPVPDATGTPMATPGPSGTPTVVAADTRTEAPQATPAPTPTAAPEATPAPTPTPEAERLMVEETVTTASQAPAAGPLDALGGLPPGVLFFAGGLLSLALVAGWWYWSRYRPLYG